MRVCDQVRLAHVECLSLTDIQLVACADEDMDRRRLHACMH
jgi:hypothetical protein